MPVGEMDHSPSFSESSQFAVMEEAEGEDIHVTK